MLNGQLPNCNLQLWTTQEYFEVDPEEVDLKQDHDSGDFCSVEELRRWLGFGRTKTFELLNAPDGIPHYRVGRKILIRKREVLAWLEDRRFHVGDK